MILLDPKKIMWFAADVVYALQKHPEYKKQGQVRSTI